MARYLAALTLVLLPLLVLARVWLMKRQGMTAMKFAATDKRDFLILPFVLLYFGIVLASAFDAGDLRSQELFHSAAVAWLGAAFCLAGLAVMVWSLVSFGRSFRIGIDADRPDKLITTGIFAFSRNPIYVAFAIVMIGEFLAAPNWMLLVFVGAALWLFHRQVLLEEEYLKAHYGQAYLAYSSRVRRYF